MSDLNSHSVWVRVDSRKTSAGRSASRTTRYGRLPAGTSFHCMSELYGLSWMSVSPWKTCVWVGVSPQGRKPPRRISSLNELQAWTFHVM